MASTLKIEAGMYSLTTHDCPSCRRESALELDWRPFNRPVGSGTVKLPVVRCTVCGYTVKAKDATGLVTFTKS